MSKFKTKVKKLGRFFKKKPVYLLALTALVAGSLGLVGVSAARGDCSPNSIVKCGAYDSQSGAGPSKSKMDENISKYHNRSEVTRIYSHYGININEVGSLPVGTVNRDGSVWLAGKKVATNAISTGRQNIGSSRPVNIGGTTVWERSPSTSFRQNSLSAWIKVENGVFKYAVILVCGNPVVGTPTYTPPPPPPTGKVSCDALEMRQVARNKFRFTSRASKTGAAAITNHIISYGDGQNGNVVTTGTAATFEHVYANPGTYKVQAGVLGKLNGNTIGDGAAKCALQITVEKPPEEPKDPNFTIKKYVNGNDAQNNNSAVTVRANEEFEYKVVVTNTGEVDLKNVRVWDTLPAGVTYVDNTLKLGGQTVSNDGDFFNSAKGVVVPSIKVGASVEFTMKAKVVAEENEVAEKCEENGTFYNNVAKADPEGTGPGLDPKEDPAVVKCQEIPPEENPSVDIEKDVSKYEVAVNEEFDWILRVTNNGDIDLKDVKVTDEAPGNIEFISAADVAGAQITVDKGNFQAIIAKLKVGEVKVFTIKSKVVKYVEGDIVNTACVDAPEVPGNPDDCDDAPVTPEPENCPIPGKENLPVDDPSCGEAPCPIPGLEQYKANDPLCQNVETPPTTTPSTGGGEIVLMAAVSLGLGGAVYGYTLRQGKRA